MSRAFGQCTDSMATPRTAKPPPLPVPCRRCSVVVQAIWLPLGLGLCGQLPQPPCFQHRLVVALATAALVGRTWKVCSYI